MQIRFVALVGLAVTAAACAASPEREESILPNGPEEVRCTDPGMTCQAFGRAADHGSKPPAYELGTTAAPARLTVVHQSTVGWDPTDLEFNPLRPKDLWIINSATGHITAVRGFGTQQQTVVERRDPAWSHFMNRPPALAMAGTSDEFGQLWGTCGDNRNGGNNFMGPTLYSAELHIFGTNNTTTNLGSHLDMLHSTPLCRGIAWGGTGNQYWTFNAYTKSVEFYDFVKDHGIGWDDHSDGIVRRFWNNQLTPVEGVVSHLSWNADEKVLYVADTGAKRILRLDPTKGRATAPMQGMEPIVERTYWEAPVEVVTEGGVLQQPAGLEASGGIAFVTDAATSQIHAFELATGKLVRSLDTQLPPGSLAGLNFGPDGKIYFVDRKGARVFRVDP